VSSKVLKRLGALLIVLFLVLAACSNDSFDQLTSGPDDVGGPTSGFAGGGDQGSEEPEPADDRAGEEADADGEQPPVQTVALSAEHLGRDIIFVAEMTVATPDVADATAQAITTIEAMGGFVFGQQSTGGVKAKSTITFKIDPDEFQEALAALSEIGEVRTQNVTASDVTDKVVDLESQIETAATSVERLRDLLDEATDIKEIVALENELLARETELETLRGQLRTIQQQVALATIVVTFTAANANPAIALTVTGYSGHDGAVGCPGDEEFSVEEGTEATVCFEIINAGDTILEDFELTDPVLDIDNEDLIVVFGDLAEPIEPGESFVVAAEVVLERTVQTRTTVTAQPVTEVGEPIGDRAATKTQSAYLQTYDPGGVPTFSQGLQASWDWLVSLGEVLLLIGGVLIPFLWIPFLVWVIWRIRRSRPKAPATQEAAQE
jgi:hypothetical protein